MNRLVIGFLSIVLCPLLCDGALVSRNSKDCISCHVEVTPGIVADWQKSAHARITIKEALAKPKRQRRVSLRGMASRSVSGPTM